VDPARLERRTGSVEVFSGDDPRPRANSRRAVVLLSNVTDVQPVDRLQEFAAEAKENIREQEETCQREMEELSTDEEDALDPV